MRFFLLAVCGVTVLVNGQPSNDIACTHPPVRLNAASGTIDYAVGATNYEDKLCQWLIEVEAGYQIRLNIPRMDLEGDIYDCYDFVSVYDGINTDAFSNVYCESTFPADITSTDNVILIQFTYGGSGSGAQGFEASWTTVQRNYEITTACTNAPLRLTEASGTITYPVGGWRYGNSLTCQWLIEVEAGYQVRLSFSRIDVQEYLRLDPMDNPYIRICHDVVNVYYGSSTSATSVGYCGTTTPGDITSFSNAMLIEFISDDSNMYTNYGFEFSWTAVQGAEVIVSACTELPLGLNWASGTIDYPEGPGIYHGDRRCLWLIEVEEGYKVHLSFSHMDVKDQDHGYGIDAVNVYDGDDLDANVEKHFGTTLPEDFTSTGNMVLVQFISDHFTGWTGFKLSWTTVIATEPNPRCRQSSGNHKAPGDEWLTTSDDGMHHKWCVCPMDRPMGVELREIDYCLGACLWSDGPNELEGNNYYLTGETWEYVRDDIGYTFECTCSDYGWERCGLKPGGHICSINGEVHYPGESGIIAEMGDVYSDRYEECDCPEVLADGDDRWSREVYCKGVCFDEDNMPHYEGQSYVDRNHKCFRYNCVCHDHGGRTCTMDVNGGHQCILERERYNPGVTWKRRLYAQNGVMSGYQECYCPLVWENPVSTYFSVQKHCRGICYENSTSTFYQDDSPYTRTDIDTGAELICQCFNAGVEFCKKA